MAVTEKRTQIYLSSNQHGSVQRLARRRHTSMAGVIREAIDVYLSTTPAREPAGDPLADLAGIFEGPGDLSIRHDDYLYGKAPATPRRRGRGRR